MAKEFSFDIVSKADVQEVRNAMDQVRREVANRYDFKGTKVSAEFVNDEISLTADDEFRMKQLQDIVVSKMVKRGIDSRQLDYGKLEPGSGVSVKQKATLKQGIPQDLAKQMIQRIKDEKLNVKTQFQGDAVRVTGKDKDELQKTMAFVKGLKLELPVKFENYR